SSETGRRWSMGAGGHKSSGIRTRSTLWLPVAVRGDGPAPGGYLSDPLVHSRCECWDCEPRRQTRRPMTRGRMADAKISVKPRSYPLSSDTSDGLQAPLGLSEDIPQRFPCTAGSALEVK